MEKVPSGTKDGVNFFDCKSSNCAFPAEYNEGRENLSRLFQVDIIVAQLLTGTKKANPSKGGDAKLRV